MRLVRFPALSILAFLVGSGCGRTGIGLDDPPSREVDLADGGAGSDGEVPDQGCAPSLQIHSVTTLPVGDAFASVIAGEGTATYLETRGEFGRLERFDLASGRESRVAEGSLRLIDATARRTLFSRVEDSQIRVMLEVDGEIRDLFEVGSTIFDLGPEPRRQLHGSLAAFCGGDGASIHAFDLESGQRFGSLAQEGIACQEPLYIEGRDIVHTGPLRNSLNAVMLYRADFTAPLPTAMAWAASVAMPVLFQGIIFHLRDGFFVSQPVDFTSQDRWMVLSEDRCSTVHASDSGVVAACGGESWGPYTASPRILFHDGREARVISAVEQDGRMAVLPRLGRGFVTWLAFDDPDVLCNGGRGEAVGHVMVAQLPDGPPIQVAPIGSGCFCCGAQWPAPLLDAEGDTIVWNYDAEGGLREPGGTNFKAARISLGCN